MTDLVEVKPVGNLANVLEQQTLKWIFVGGKLASVRKSVLIISTDPAHNLSDAFKQKFSKTPTLVQGFTNLFAMEIDPTPDTADFEQLEWAQDNFLTELAGSIPGIDEAMSFAEVMKQVQTMDYSAIVFDTAPTGHTLRLLNFPTILEKGLSKLMGLKDAMGGMMGQVTRMFGMGGEENVPDMLLGKLEGMLDIVRQVNTQFKDATLTTFVCVCIPEFLSLYETERLVQELAKFEMDTRNIIINQVLYPESVGSSKLLEARIRMQQKYLEQFDELYEDFHITRLPLLEEEIRGVEALQTFSVNLVQPYQPPAVVESADATRAAALASEVAVLKTRVAELEGQLALQR